ELSPETSCWVAVLNGGHDCRRTFVSGILAPQRVKQFADRHKTVAVLPTGAGIPLQVIEPLSQSDRASHPLHHRTLLSVGPLSHQSMSDVRKFRHGRNSAGV